MISNLTLDPDLDTYYLQNIVANQLPTLLGQLGEAHVLFHERPQPAEAANEQNLRFVLDGLLRSTTDGIDEDLTSAYRGNQDGRLKRAVAASFAAMSQHARAYLSALNATRVDNEARGLIVGVDTGIARFTLWTGGRETRCGPGAARRSSSTGLLRQRID